MIIGDARWVSWPRRTPPTTDGAADVPERETGHTRPVTRTAGGVTELRTTDRGDGMPSPRIVAPQENRTRDSDRRRDT